MRSVERRAGRPRRMLLLVAWAGLMACVPVTININFPQHKIEGAASRIEEMVRTPEATPGPRPGPEPKKEGSLIPAASAQTREVEVVPDLKVQTPEILRIIESRRNRFSQIREWMARGCMGENNQGLVESRPGQGCDQGAVQQLAAEENRDRISIYETLRQQNNMPPADIERIKRGFAKVNREKAVAGTWVQEPDGRWTRK